MVLIISYRIIYLLRNVTPVATRSINEEPNIYVATPVLRHPDNTLAFNPLSQLRAILPWHPSTSLYYRQKVSLGRFATRLRIFVTR